MHRSLQKNTFLTGLLFLIVFFSTIVSYAQEDVALDSVESEIEETRGNEALSFENNVDENSDVVDDNEPQENVNVAENFETVSDDDDGDFEIVNGQIQVRQTEKPKEPSLMDRSYNLGIHLGTFYTMFIQSQKNQAVLNWSNIDPFEKWIGSSGELGVVLNYHLTKKVGLVTGLNFQMIYFYRSKGVKILASESFDKTNYFIDTEGAVPEIVSNDARLLEAYNGMISQYNDRIRDAYGFMHIEVKKQKILYYMVSLPVAARFNPSEYVWLDLGSKLNFLVQGKSLYETPFENAKDPFKMSSILLADIIGGVGGTFRLNGVLLDCGIQLAYSINSIDTDYREESKLFSIGLNLNFWLF